MNDAVLVGRLECFGDLPCNRERLVKRKRSCCRRTSWLWTLGCRLGASRAGVDWRLPTGDCRLLCQQLRQRRPFDELQHQRLYRLP